MDSLRSLTERIKAKAFSLGFSIAGVTDANPLKKYPLYTDWIRNQYHAGMEYLASSYHLRTRTDPRLLVPEAQSIIVLALPYRLHGNRYLSQPETSLISGYASGEDYHSRIPRLLDDFLVFLTRESASKNHLHVFTDTSPILERELGSRAGLGWIGRNSCLISPKIGSAFLLAEVFIDQPLVVDEPYIHDRCGSCRRCVEACPTGCILPDRTIDSRQCISYHTIENHGEIPEEIMQQMGGWIFGCDICQMVCPWNSKHREGGIFGDVPEVLEKQNLVELLKISDEGFKQMFGNTALARTKKRGLVRNVLIRLGNMKDSTSANNITQLLSSTSDPVLIQTAHWALKQMQ